MEKFLTLIAEELGLKAYQVNGTIQLLEEGNTVPFITRYRKEVTGGLQEDEIRGIQEKYNYYKALEERRNTILETISSQGKLTEELKKKILEATKLKTLEDLYLPYKPKKRTLATIAREKGLGEFGDALWEQKMSQAEFLQKVEESINPEKKLESREDVLLGLQHILAEKISEIVEVRETARKLFREHGILESSPTKEEKEKEEISQYRDYFDFSQKVTEIPPHRVLALNRGEKEKALRVDLSVPEDLILDTFSRLVIKSQEPEIRSLFSKAIEDSFHRLIYPSITREIRHDLTQKAEEHALGVFAQNLRKVLLAPPVRQRRILGIDPGYRTGCKIAAIDEFGNLLEVGVIYPHEPQKEIQKSKAIILALLQKHNLDLIVIGNGTAHRETEELVSDLIEEYELSHVEYMIVSEAGASVYSASKEAQEEFPNLEASYRGTISIARRVQDPLAEIVKIDPKSMGVGMYQHDVSPKALAQRVDEVVESCVNYVGVDVNTASVSLLKHIAGLNRLQARRIVEHRQKEGPFPTRESLLKVRGIGTDTFTQAAGFLRIMDGENPLDNTQIHPESYDKTLKLLEEIGVEPSKLRDSSFRPTLISKLESLDLPKMAEKLGIGLPTLTDIVENLKKPGRDPRDDLPKPVFRKGILKLEDLQPGMELTGTVRNVVDFGAFVDIGLKEDGLIHISELSDDYVSNPHDVIAVGDIVKVRILDIDVHRRRIALSRKSPGKEERRIGVKEKVKEKRKGQEKGKEKKGGKKSSSSRGGAAKGRTSSSMGNLGLLLQKELEKDS